MVSMLEILTQPDLSIAVKTTNKSIFAFLDLFHICCTELVQVMECPDVVVIFVQRKVRAVATTIVGSFSSFIG